MSVVGFRARNHPQQLALRGPQVEVDDRTTTAEMFEPLHARFGFTIDVAASPANARCDRFFTVEDDGLAQSWAGTGGLMFSPEAEEYRTLTAPAGGPAARSKGIPTARSSVEFASKSPVARLHPIWSFGWGMPGTPAGVLVWYRNC